MKKKPLTAKAKKTNARKVVDPDLAQLGNRFREIRKKLGYTSYETFAYEHEFSRITYGKMETGQNVTYKSLLKFVRAADMTLEEFFSEGFE